MALRKVHQPKLTNFRNTDTETSFSLVYTVEYTDEIDADSASVIITRAEAALTANDGTTAIPANGTTVSGVTLTNKTVRDIEGLGRTFEVTTDYTTNKAIIINTESPLTRAAVFSYASEEVVEYPLYDRDSVLLRNTAGDFFDPPISDVRHIVNITLQKNVSNAIPYYLLVDKVNSASVTLDGVSYNTNTLLCTDVNIQVMTDGSGTDYDNMTVTFRYDPKTFTTQVYSTGYRERDASGNLIPIRDGNNIEVTSPYPLDSTGAAEDSALATPAIQTFNLKSEASFAPFASL